MVKEESSNYYLLKLNEDLTVKKNNDETLMIPVNSKLRISAPNELHLNDMVLITNANQQSLTLNQVENNLSEFHNDILPIILNEVVYFDILLDIPGSVFFLISYKNLKKENCHSKAVYIVVEPVVGELDVSCIRIQTVLSKSLGLMENWDKYFQEASFLSKIKYHHFRIQLCALHSNSRTWNLRLTLLYQRSSLNQSILLQRR